jgi:hypothetical protein
LFDLHKLPKRTKAILQISNPTLRKAPLVHAVKKKDGVYLLQNKERSGIYGLNLKPAEKVLVKLCQISVKCHTWGLPFTHHADIRW